jgi:hypothetical protein
MATIFDSFTMGAMHQNLDVLNIIVHAANLRCRTAWNDRIRRFPLHDPEWLQVKARAERESQRFRVWIDRLHAAQDAHRASR